MNKKNIKVITGWDDFDKIKLLIKENGKRKIKTISNFEWFFSTTKKDYEKIPLSLLNKYNRSGILLKTKEEGDYVKIYLTKNFRTKYLVEKFINELREKNIQPLEADLSLTKCWLHNNLIEIENDLDILFFDIETDDSVGRIKIGRDRILSWAACDSAGKTFFDSGDEKEILMSLIRLIHKHDVFCGWNSAKFDLPYIQARMKIHGLQYNWKKRVHVDLMQRLIKLFGGIMGLLNLSGFSLNEVAKTFLQREKVKFDGKIIDLYHNDFETFKKYNIYDAKLLYDLDQKIMALPLMIKECVWTGTFLNKFYIGELLDNYILREAKRRKQFLTTKPTQKEQAENLEINIRGGYVMEPKVGLYRNVRIFDFKSLYPSIIVGWNIGHDSLNKKLSEEGDKSFEAFLKEKEQKVEEVSFKELYNFLIKEKKRLDPKNKHYQTANNNFFKRNKSSFIGDLIKNLLEQRKSYKARLDELTIDTDEYRNARAQQEVVKEMANSMYGITAERRGRYFNKNIAEAITLTGQFLNKTLAAIARKEGFLVIYSDTDSVFLVIDNKENMKKIADSLNKKLKNFLDAKFELKDNIIFAEYEKKYRKMIMLDKKRYTGHLTWMDGKKTDTIFTRGIETVKKNTIEYTRRNLNDMINMIVKENKTVKEIKKWLKELKNEVLTGELSKEELTIKTKITKPTYKYKSKPVHVQLAEKMIEDGKILQPTEGKHSWGEPILYIITQTKPKQKAVHVDDFNGEWDRKYYWDVQIYAPINRILKAVWPDKNWDEHNILLMEKLEIKKIKEAEKIEKEKEKERKKKEREINKKEKEDKNKKTSSKQPRLF